MSKLGQSLLKGAEEALAYAKGNRKNAKTHHVKIPKKVDVSTIRDKLHMSQNAFAENFGFSTRTIEKWEQGVRQPAGAARAYLIVIDRNPEMVQAALSSFMSSQNSHKKVHRKEKASNE